jgi:hypothetical protein
LDRGHIFRSKFAAIFDINSKIRAEQSTQTTIYTLVIIDDLRRVIPFGVDALRNGEVALGAELNTKTAPLTTVIDDMHDTVSNLDAISVERLSPIGHGSSSALLCLDLTILIGEIKLI